MTETLATPITSNKRALFTCRIPEGLRSLLCLSGNWTFTRSGHISGGCVDSGTATTLSRMAFCSEFETMMPGRVFPSSGGVASERFIETIVPRFIFSCDEAASPTAPFPIRPAASAPSRCSEVMSRIFPRLPASFLCAPHAELLPAHRKKAFVRAVLRNRFPGVARHLA